MKIQHYLALDGDCSRWAVLANRIINIKVAKTHNYDEDTMTNLLLQQTIVDMRAMDDSLSTLIQRMLQVAKKYHVTFHLLILENGLKGQMPV